MRLVLVEWIDSYGCASSWEHFANTQPKVMTCKSVGWLLHDNDDCKTIVPHIADDPDQGCGDMTIPAKAITRMVDLQVPA